jgi:hypothetical protein
MDNFLNENAEFDLSDLIADMLAQQLVQKAQVEVLTAFVRVTIEHLAPSSDVSLALLRSLDTVLKQKFESLKHDNPVVQQVLKKKVKNDLGDISGVVWPE